MSNKISLIAFATCGNPYGFRQTFFGDSNKALAGKIKTFDLNTNAIKLFPDGKIYGIRKEFVNGNSVVSYAIYSFAKEQNSSRGGTFIGSGIIFENEIAEENITISKLNEFHKNLISKNTQNDIILVNHSDNFSVSKLKDFDKINFNLRKIETSNSFQPSNLSLVVYSEIHADKLQHLFKKAIGLLKVYDNIYFTDNNEIAEFVLQKGLFKLIKEVGFEQEIQNLQEERKQKIKSSIIEFEKEQEKLQEDKAMLIKEYKLQIEYNEKLHEENSRKIDESKKTINLINQNFDSYSQQIDNSIKRLKADEKLEEILAIHSENKRIFIETNDRQRPLNSLRNINMPNVETGVKVRDESRYPEHDFISNKNYNKLEVDGNINIYKLISLLLFLILTGILTYFFVFYNAEVSKPILSQEVQFPAPSLSEPQLIQDLIPNFNVELSEKSYKAIAEKARKDVTVDKIVKVIFDANPSDVKKAYLYQKENYGKLLISLNSNSFKDSGNQFFCFTGDNIKRIPAYRDSLALEYQ